MMKLAVVLFAVLACVSAQFGRQQRLPISNSKDKDVPILRFVNNVGLEGQYDYAFETGNGIQQQENGYLKNAGSDNEIQVAEGSYSFTTPEGQVVTITYIADENGFQAQGDAIPTPPPIPVEIQRALDLIARTSRTQPAAQPSRAQPPRRFQG